MTWVGSGHISTLLTKGKVSSLMKTKSKRQRKFKETWVSKKWNKSGATLDERWRRRRNKDKREMDDDRRSGIATRKVKTAKPLKMPQNLGIFLSFFLSLFHWFTLYRPIFIFRPISSIFPEWPVRLGISSESTSLVYTVLFL